MSLEVEKSEVGVRFDEGKIRYDLIPPEWITALANILTMGAKKYADRNWEKGMAHSRIVGALFRHLFARLRGEFYDEESKFPHMAHVAWNALALMSYDLRGLGEKNLPLEVSAQATKGLNA